MEKLTTKKQINILTALFMLTYMVSYITRINYGAVISEICASEGILKSQLSMAVTGSFITYGTGQIVSGICGDRFSPKKLVSLGLLVTTAMNLLLPLCRNPYLMTAVWCVNGFAQSFMWPPIVRLMSAKLSEDDYKVATVRVSWGSSFGTIAVYLIAPLFISVASWRALFVFSASAGALMLILWSHLAPDVEPEPRETKDASGVKMSAAVFLKPMMICIMLAIVCQGMLRDGVTTWMPSYISETYSLSSSISILTGVVLPIFSILSFQVTSMLYRSIFKNPLVCAGVIFGLGAVCATVLAIFAEGNAVLSVTLSALLTGCMHGVNLILVCMIPPFFKKNGNVSTAAGVLNACTYIGSATSTYGIALLSEQLGWGFTLISWAAVAVMGTLLCLAISKAWGKAHPNNE